MTTTETTTANVEKPVVALTQGAHALGIDVPQIPNMLKAGGPPPAPEVDILVTTPPSVVQTPRSQAEPLQFVQRNRSALAAVAEQATDSRTCSLPKGLTFKGEAHYPCDVRIEGVVDGTLTAEPNRTITVERDGKVKGSLKATNVRVEGTADGEITATGGLASFGVNAVCKGHITYGRLSISEGADVEASMKKLATA
jgi:cytoskeletal protein CcmA (bactofilin family)